IMNACMSTLYFFPIALCSLSVEELREKPALRLTSSIRWVDEKCLKAKFTIRLLTYGRSRHLRRWLASITQSPYCYPTVGLFLLGEIQIRDRKCRGCHPTGSRKCAWRFSAHLISSRRTHGQRSRLFRKRSPTTPR